MHPGMQATHLHEVPRQAKKNVRLYRDKELRFNVTLRVYKEAAGPSRKKQRLLDASLIKKIP